MTSLYAGEAEEWCAIKRTLDLLLLDIQIETLKLQAKANFNQNQPRVSAGNADGGEWADNGGRGHGRSNIRDRPNTGDNNRNAQSRSTVSPPKLTKIPIQGSNNAKYNNPQDVVQHVAPGLIEEQARHGAEVGVAIFRRNGKYGVTDAQTTGEVGQGRIPTEYVPYDAEIVGSIHTHPGNLNRGDGLSPKDAKIYDQLPGQHFVVTPDGDIWKIPEGANIYVRIQ